MNRRKFLVVLASLFATRDIFAFTPGFNGFLAANAAGGGGGGPTVTADVAQYYDNVGVSPWPITLPANIASGDLVVISLYFNQVVGTGLTAAGWTFVNPNANYSAFMYKICTGSEGATVSVTGMAGGTGTQTLATRITGAHQTTPIQSSSQKTFNAGASATNTVPAITPSTANTLSLASFCWIDGGASTYTSVSNGYTANIIHVPPYFRGVLAWKSIPTAVSTNSVCTITVARTSQAGYNIIVAPP